jgi:hypothetical protein
LAETFALLTTKAAATVGVVVATVNSAGMVRATLVTVPDPAPGGAL